MANAILVGGPYHGTLAVESTDADGVLRMIGAQGDHQYGYMETVANLRFFKHVEFSIADVRRFLSSNSSP